MADAPRYHVLLIGIDAYRTRPLRGCVNDIDAVEQVLLDPRVAIPPESITRLASPQPSTTHPPGQPATLANIRAALQRLGSDAVQSGDRVFIYYSGHGTRTPVSTPTGLLHREALVPVDFDAQPGRWQLLFDFELNALLAAILERTSAVTIVLDCCHSSGATRGVLEPEMSPRSVDITAPIALSPDMTARATEGARGFAVDLDDCHVVTACLSHELAQESLGPDGVRHGLLTRALVTELATLPADVSMREVPWARIWQAMRAAVETANPSQHLWMAGNLARAVLAGPPVDADAGLAIRRSGPNAYSIAAGTLAGITPGAVVAIYGDRPTRFPPLDSDEDRNARVGGLLQIMSSDLAEATGEAQAAPFDLPSGSRGRLVKAGSAAPLRCAVVPPDAAIEATLRASPLLEVVDANQAEARLERRGAEDVWSLTDDVHGAKPDYPVLCTLRGDQRDLAAMLLEQYHRYSLPLRMAASCRDLAGELQLTVLRCPPAGALTDDEKDGIGLPEAGSQGAFTYDLVARDRVAFRVRNTSRRGLKVILLNAAASGRVEYLGDQIIDAGDFYVFWRGNTRGNPFSMTLPAGVTQAIDRLVAIGTTAFGADLRYLQTSSKFAQILAQTRGGEDLKDDTASGPPRDQWTATQAVMRSRAT